MIPYVEEFRKVWDELKPLGRISSHVAMDFWTAAIRFMQSNPQPERTDDEGIPWCKDCQSWHAIPRDLEHHKSLLCQAPFAAPESDPQVAANPIQQLIINYANDLKQLRAQLERVTKERDEAKATLDDICRDRDGGIENEQSRWQNAIYEALQKLVPAANIDGSGCESGDPLDLTIAEIGQALVRVIDERDEALKDKERLDWLQSKNSEKKWSISWRDGYCECTGTIRESIDAVMIALREKEGA